MLRRLLFTFVLIFLFGFGQQAALTHAVGHIADLQQHDPSPEKSHHAPACDKCVSYAELGHVLGSTAFSLPDIASVFQTHATPVIHAGFVSCSPYSARAPPALA